MANEIAPKLKRLLAILGCLYACTLVTSLLVADRVHYPGNTGDLPEKPSLRVLARPDAILQQAFVEVETDDLRAAAALTAGNTNQPRSPSPLELRLNTANSSWRSILDMSAYQLVLNQFYLCRQVDDDEEAAAGYPNGGLPVYLLIIVHSHPSHRQPRDSIRETWGRVVKDYDGGRQVALVFILGLPRDYEEYMSVKREARLFRDVVIWDFRDDYRNLTLKSVAGLYWASVHCSTAHFVAKVDDDIYLDVPHLLDILGGYGQKGLILGSLNSHSPVKRYGQWRVDRSLYPDDNFPPYCSGCAYVLSGDMASKLYAAAQFNYSDNKVDGDRKYRDGAGDSDKQGLIPVEDAFVTGVLAKRVGVRCRHDGRFPTWISVPSARFAQHFLRRQLVGLHGVDWLRMHAIWRMERQCGNCSTDQRETGRWLEWGSEKDTVYR